MNKAVGNTREGIELRQWAGKRRCITCTKPGWQHQVVAVGYPTPRYVLMRVNYDGRFAHEFDPGDRRRKPRRESEI